MRKTLIANTLQQIHSILSQTLYVFATWSNIYSWRSNVISVTQDHQRHTRRKHFDDVDTLGRHSGAAVLHAKLIKKDIRTIQPSVKVIPVPSSTSQVLGNVQDQGDCKLHNQYCCQSSMVHCRKEQLM